MSAALELGGELAGVAFGLVAAGAGLAWVRPGARRRRAVSGRWSS